MALKKTPTNVRGKSNSTVALVAISKLVDIVKLLNKLP